jgi:RHS repeat-associated protein
VEHIESKVTQVADYYPFGMQIKQTSTEVSNPLANKYLYNGKEFQSELGLDWYDYGARMYNPAIGRFGIKDRLTELYPSLNPYQYTANNPIRFVDINGDYIDIYDEENSLRLIYEDGKTYFTKYDDDGNIVKGDEYDGEGTDFTNAVVQNLNDVSSTKNGKKVISSLSESKNNFTFLNSTPSNGGFNAFVPENDGRRII